MNDSAEIAGFYLDEGGVAHGFTLTYSGALTLIDFPGASSTAGSAPCVSGPIAGTVVDGINNAGYLSGHYWDTSYNEHGFLRTPAGKFIELNVPGAYQTAGGGLNYKLQVDGYDLDASCNASGYIATP